MITLKENHRHKYKDLAIRRVRVDNPEYDYSRPVMGLLTKTCDCGKITALSYKPLNELKRAHEQKSTN